jgi:hypothetical protein
MLNVKIATPLPLNYFKKKWRVLRSDPTINTAPDQGQPAIYRSSLYAKKRAYAYISPKSLGKQLI